MACRKRSKMSYFKWCSGLATLDSQENVWQVAHHRRYLHPSCVDVYPQDDHPQLVAALRKAAIKPDQRASGAGKSCWSPTPLRSAVYFKLHWDVASTSSDADRRQMNVLNACRHCTRCEHLEVKSLSCLGFDRFILMNIPASLLAAKIAIPIHTYTPGGRRACTKFTEALFRTGLTGKTRGDAWIVHGLISYMQNYRVFLGNQVLEMMILNPMLAQTRSTIT